MWPVTTWYVIWIECCEPWPNVCGGSAVGGIVFSVTHIFLDVRKKKTLMECLVPFWPWHVSDIQVEVLLIRKVWRRPRRANKL